MPITNGYATLPEFKAWNEIDTVTNDSDAERAIEAASRWVDQYCQRVFWKSTAEPRIFDAACGTELRFGPFDDLAALTSIQTDDNGDGTYETTWVAGDYQLLPLRPASAPEQRPYRSVRALGSRSFPTRTDRAGLVRVTGEWGWPDVPTAVAQATLIQASRIYKRRNSPEGVSGFGSDFGVIRLSAKPDPDAVGLLGPYRLVAMMVA